MNVELSSEEAALVREFIEGRLIDLGKEINRTESIEFRKGLRRTARALERLVGQLTPAAER